MNSLFGIIVLSFLLVCAIATPMAQAAVTDTKASALLDTIINWFLLTFSMIVSSVGQSARNMPIMAFINLFHFC